MNNTSVQNQGGWEVNGGHLETSTPELWVQVLFYMLTTQWHTGRTEKGMILGQQTCTLALRELRQTMRWRLWDSNNPSGRAKGRWEEDTERVRGKTRRGSGAGEEMKECHQHSLVSVHSQLPLLCVTDIELRRPSKALGKCVTGPPVLFSVPRPHPWTFQKEFGAHLCHIRICREASQGQLILITVVQEMQQLQCPIQVPGPETESGLEICGMLVLLPFPLHTSSVQLLGWLWRPQHTAPTITLHTSVSGETSPLLTIHGQHHTCDLHLHFDLVRQLLKKVQARQSWLSQVFCHVWKHQ